MIPAMSDRTPTDSPPGGQQDSDGVRQDATVGVVEASRILGMTTDAVRSRLRRGTLEGHKVDDEWRVVIPADRTPTGEQQDATGDRQDDPTGGDSRRQDAGPVDLTPLAELIRDQQRRIEELSSASAFWQVRALQAEEQLKAITAGNDTTAEEPDPEPADEVIEPPQSDAPEPTGIAAWWKRLWSG